MVQSVTSGFSCSFTSAMEWTEDSEELLYYMLGASVAPSSDLKLVSKRWYIPDAIVYNACLVGCDYTEKDYGASVAVQWHAAKVEYIHHNLLARFVYFLWCKWHRITGWLGGKR